MIVEYKDIPVFYQDEGEGNVVVLLHGFLETSIMWKNFIPEFRKNSRIITVDLLGHGDTGCLGYIHTMEMMADAVMFVLNHLGISKCTVVGHSMGGYVALAMAQAFPEKVERLCLLNSMPFADSPERQINRTRAVEAVKYNHKNFISLSIANLFSPDTRQLFNGEIERIKMIAMRLPVQGIIAALEGMKLRKDRSEILQRMPNSNLVILGIKDPVIDYHMIHSQIMAMGVELISFPDGHMSFIENKKELTYSLLHFIEK